jgi:hypothetical protein
MHLSNIKVLGLCLLLGFAVGAAAGVVFAVASDRLVSYGIATGLLVVGLIALALGLLGATEPQEGWSLKRRREEMEESARRSLAARAAREHPSIRTEVNSMGLAVWGLVVGGGLIGLSMLFFSFAG